MEEYVKEGIERYIKHVRIMQSLTDEQIKLVITKAAENDSDLQVRMGMDIDEYIEQVRTMASYSDDQLRSMLIRLSENPDIQEVFRDASRKKAFLEMKKMAEDVKSDARSFARSI